MAETGKVFKKEKDMKKGMKEKLNILIIVYDTRHDLSFSISCICSGVDKLYIYLIDTGQVRAPVCCPVSWFDRPETESPKKWQLP